MIRASLCVVVRELGPREYSWTLVRKENGSGLAECVAASSTPFQDYDEALDAGFEALQAFCRGAPTEGLDDRAVSSGTNTAGSPLLGSGESQAIRCRE